MVKMVMRWKHRLASRAWRAWEVMIIEKHRLRIIAHKVAGRWKNRVSACDVVRENVLHALLHAL